ncbi:GDSL esterase/lipase At5g03820-like [Diospyros lotus]|uniref:GDSL esterase/lipase At5g03820-like n=1 Tax=Diospyros lotus TaxID=55363 RepID=UPI00225B3FA5|nr:GDSL esterase/lipase At5g03820-like [Diospyros lotus]
MGFCMLSVFIIIGVAVVAVKVAEGQIVPMLCVFGDSVVDVGNNNNLNTMIKANFLTHGREFVTHKLTGRFCNGKLATDFTAEYLGFSSYPPTYLSQDANGKNLLTGANFASGYFDGTAQFYGAISLSQQLAYYKEYQDELVGTKTNGIHLLSAGSSDFLQTITTSILSSKPSPLISFQTFSSDPSLLLSRLGVRKIGVTTVPPIGCLPHHTVWLRE